MCTVTYIPKHKGFILTSNRDEKVLRATIVPRKYQKDDIILCYPKDALAGGSWIAMSNHRRVVCLLNGAFVPHVKQVFHTHSRGKVLIDAAKTSLNPEVLFSAESLAHTEPFTLLTIDFDEQENISFSELIWDGKEKYHRQLNAKMCNIWSSVTLYSKANQKERQWWFREFLNRQAMNPSASNMIRFHSGNYTNNHEVNVLMEREGGLKTVSTTQIIYKEGHLKMNYFDLIDHTEHTIYL